MERGKERGLATEKGIKTPIKCWLSFPNGEKYHFVVGATPTTRINPDQTMVSKNLPIKI